jgi:DNA repair exonuclease SbcCD ATPase subunit
LAQAQEELADLEAAERAAATQAFGGDLLPGTGGGAWKQMFLAAEQFIAGAEDRCGLCQQALFPDARERLRGFREFLRGDLSQRVEAQRARVEAMAQAKPTPPPSPKLRRLKDCVAAVETRSLTAEAKQLAASVVGRGLRQSLAQELATLTAGRFSLDLQAAGRAGQPFLKLKLRQTMNTKAEAEAVLSEGEQRMAALACFFAELDEGRFTCAVLDDPATSLDPPFSRSVAQRIMASARGRQMIVFTHDGVFAEMLAAASDSLGVRTAQRRIVRRERLIGLVENVD